ncbi:ABC transporter ATP-binding protein [Isachenkonia alkalipeptolytica]|uniref:ABC transporter ATP-binding protein n=1 Tax=Isachenkonia alkalipeptolytica TaxID=2565777 RepID=A0AA43XJD7_9CLOT|nr:ABC transporter ATP-binding protein [Isachenkonia alkalipeptolytica]NBG86975.1 ABC transporter ATP-binding protein [Isachenkonia alkalipeptolytica]
MDSILTLKNIDKVYGRKIQTQVIFDLNLSFDPGSFNSIIGQSGSGKSTLLNIMGTLDKPTKGKVFVDGRDTGELKKDQLAKLRNEAIGFVFQFHYLLPEFTTLENILMPQWVKNKKIDPEIQRRAEELIEVVGLEKVKNNLATDMSGGQQQRAAIARALMNRPRILLADEPTGNLDSETSNSIYRLLKEINKEFQSTFIVITHDKKIAERTDRIIELKDGRVYTDLSQK